MLEFLLSPPLLLITGSVALAAAPRSVMPQTVRRALLLALPVYSLWRFWGLEPGSYAQFEIFGETLTLMRIDRLSRVFALIFHIAAFIGSIYSLYVKDNFQPLVGVFYAGSALGVVLAGDLWTLFLFWRWRRCRRRSWFGSVATAGLSPPVCAISACRWSRGSCCWAGIVLLRHDLGAAPGWSEFRNLTGLLEDGGLGFTNLAPTLILLAFGLKAAFPLLHSWLIDAYPRVDAGRGRVPLGLHDQVRDLRPGARLPGPVRADLDRGRDDRVPDLLRRDRERPAPGARLQHDEPARLHGRRHRHRHPVGAQRRRRPRLRRRPVQGPAVHGHGRGPLPGRPRERFGPRRPLQVDAAHDRSVHHRRGPRSRPSRCSRPSPPSP